MGFGSVAFAASQLSYRSDVLVTTEHAQDTQVLLHQAWRSFIRQNAVESKAADIKISSADLSTLVTSYQWLQRDQQRVFEVNFVPAAVWDWFKKNQIVLWQGQHPNTLVLFIAQQPGQSPVFLSTDHSAIQTMLPLAKQHDLSLILPLNDLADQRDLQQWQKSAPTVEQLRQIAKRYQVSSICLVNALTPGSQHWWWWQQGSAALQNWQITADDLDTAVQMGCQHWFMAMATAHQPIMSNTASLLIVGVRDFKAYTQLQQAMHAHAILRSLHTDTLSPMQVSFKGGEGQISTQVAWAMQQAGLRRLKHLPSNMLPPPLGVWLWGSMSESEALHTLQVPKSVTAQSHQSPSAPKPMLLPLLNKPAPEQAMVEPYRNASTYQADPQPVIPVPVTVKADSDRVVSFFSEGGWDRHE